MQNHPGIIIWICRTGQKPEPEAGMFKIKHGVMSCYPQVSVVVNFTKYYSVCMEGGGGEYWGRGRRGKESRMLFFKL